jgi:hypothetical protein
MEKYYRLEDITQIASDIGVSYETLCCGYVRQPFTIKASPNQASLRGYCAHFNTSCQRKVRRGDVWGVEDCGLYQIQYPYTTKK